MISKDWKDVVKYGGGLSGLGNFLNGLENPILFYCLQYPEKFDIVSANRKEVRHSSVKSMENNPKIGNH